MHSVRPHSSRAFSFLAGMADSADMEDHLQLWKDSEDLVHQARRHSLPLWGLLLRRLGLDLGFRLGCDSGGLGEAVTRNRAGLRYTFTFESLAVVMIASRISTSSANPYTF